MASQDAMSKFEADFKQQQSEMTNKIDTVLKAITDRIAGVLPSNTVKNPKLSTYPVFSTRSYLTEDPQCSTHIHGSINAITIHPKQQSKSHDKKPKEKEEEEKDNPENIHVNPSVPPDPSISFITEKVLKLNSFFESLGLHARQHIVEPQHLSYAQHSPFSEYGIRRLGMGTAREHIPELHRHMSYAEAGRHGRECSVRGARSDRDCNAVGNEEDDSGFERGGAQQRMVVTEDVGRYWLVGGLVEESRVGMRIVWGVGGGGGGGEVDDLLEGSWVLSLRLEIKGLFRRFSRVIIKERDYGVVGDDYEGALVFNDDYEEATIFNDDQFKEESMPVYDTDIEDVIEEEEGFDDVGYKINININYETTKTTKPLNTTYGEGIIASFSPHHQSSSTELVCTKGDDGDVMFIEIVKTNDDSHKEEPEVREQEVEYFNIFLTRSELAYHKYLMCGPIPSIFLRNPIITKGCPSNLKIPCNIRHVHVEKAYIDPNSPLNIMTRMMYNWIMRRKLDPRENSDRGVSNFTGRIKGMHVFIGNFTYIIDFMIVEDISSIINPRLSQVVLGRPFVEISNMTHDPPEGVVRFTNGTDEVAYKMPHKIEQYNSLSNLEKEHTKLVYLRNDEDRRRGVEYVMSKIL
ncbi:hypothetical protein Tco_0879624 [Tanacetum coccineum]